MSDSQIITMSYPRTNHGIHSAVFCRMKRFLDFRGYRNLAIFRFAWLVPLYCLAFMVPAQGAVLIPFDSSWKLLKGFSEASAPDTAGWRRNGFNDSAWTTAPAPFWYGDVQPTPGTQLTDMRGGYTSIFLRKNFSVTAPGEISVLKMEAQSDDGFIAWINGVEVARFNVPDGEPTYDGKSLPALTEPIAPQNFELTGLSNVLVPGVNVLTVQGFNADISTSSDFVFNVSLSSFVDDIRPTITEVIPPAGSAVQRLQQIEVIFNEPVTGVDAPDLLLNGAPATNLLVFSSSQYVFEFSQSALGIARVTWKSDHGIHDLAPAGNAFQGNSWTYDVRENVPAVGVTISEFMAENDRTLNDEDGDSSDWIEIQNATAINANLAGWHLTDDPLNLRKWRFPNVSVPARGYLLLFASNKDRTNAAARLHTNFKLKSDGGYLAISNPDGTIISEFAPSYPEQRLDVSYGQDRGDSTIHGYFTQPTPGAPNSVSGPGFAPEVLFSRAGGTFTDSFTLTLTTSSGQAKVHYTLDGTLPTESSLMYVAPITVAGTVQVRARAFEPRLLPGRPRSESFVQLAASVVNFTSNLPILIIHNFGQGTVPANSDQFAYMAFFEPANELSSLQNPPSLSSRAGINIRGSSTEGLAKSSFAVEWWDEFNLDKPLSPLGLPADADWVLYAPNNFEPVLIHNPFIYRLSNEIGRYAPRTRFVEVYLNKSGGPITSANYNGIYVLEEKIGRSDNRVGVPKLEAEHLKSPEVTGGYIMKIDRLDPGDGGLSAGGQTIGYVEPKEREIELPQRDPQEQYIRNYMNAFGTALNGAGFTNLNAGFRQYVDVPSWIDHHILNVVAFNVDALRLSTYFYKQREGKLFFGPIWDFDRALGSTDGRDANPRVWSASGGTDFFTYPWWGRMFQDINFWQDWVDRYQELRQSHFAVTNLNRIIDSLVAEVRAAQPREQKRWNFAPRGGSYTAEVNFTKNWLTNRLRFMDTNFLQWPVLGLPEGFVTPGTRLALSGPPGATIYYTVDGTDPRLPFGAVSPAAVAYTGPVVLNSNARVVARSFKSDHRNLTGGTNPRLSTPWSGVVAATYVITTPSLIITEIMYHPEVAPAGNTNTADAFEFIELKNTGQGTINLNGFRLSGGVDFVFPQLDLPAGRSVVVASDVVAFRSRYGAEPLVVGAYTGKLDNDSERLVLEGPLREPILDFKFADSWQRITDGPGFSLVIAEERLPLASWGERSSWRRSSRVGGSPAKDDPAPTAIPVVVVNEALTHTDPPLIDAIELLNTTSGLADVSGWYLTDDFDFPKKFKLPHPTRLIGGGYHVVAESEFNSGGANAFSLSSLGDEVFLFSADAAGNLTGYHHGFSFGAAQNGVSFGRHSTTIGEEHFAAQTRATLGSVNSGPRIGPVVFSEILYLPSIVAGIENTASEFIEVANSSSQPIRLFDPAAPTNTWRIRGGIDFDFPPGISLPVGGLAVVVSFDPLREPGALDSFRSLYQIPAGAVILGPYDEKLSNLGEELRLLKPDPPQGPEASDPGLVPYVLVDLVDYSADTPWPRGVEGQSLQRIRGDSYGNDPASWKVAAPTAGKFEADVKPMDDFDGLPTEWESAHGLDPQSGAGDDGPASDPDHDGLTNLQEFLAGTHPKDAASTLRVGLIDYTNAGVTIGFTAQPLKAYSVLVRDDGGDGTWKKLADITAQSSMRAIRITDPETVGTRFYQVVTPPLP